MAVRNRGFNTQEKTITSPIDPEVTFTIRRADNRADVARSNLFNRIRYRTDDQGNQYAERDAPLGDLQIQTVLLCLKSWSLEKQPGIAWEVNENTVTDLLAPEERVYLYEQILLHNPIWVTTREQEKND